MTAQHTYRPILAALFLAVYAFIATPVQWWHHHQYNVKLPVAKESNGAKSDSISQGAAISFETDCPVCSHKYSAYNDAVLTPFEITAPAIATAYGYFSPQHPAASPVSLPNKGPPALS